ncbi:site-2 protease family protein [Thermobrachium celere]|uniref:FIG004556: membrane metalloprotease n=1 Tax=Thermobrachium celere DSM 8682 TaxID=941824 RepID=R7RQ51_9CLOT|nr:site-2 protease family protein [Thermobrachium celere]CDF58184.1 FIG004556: membrane metalloprotease [Thermobrachium celere DSM 8682]
MISNNFSETIFVIIAIIVSLTIHEYSHAVAATVLGDDTPKVYNRLTFNPFSHIDLVGFLALLVVKFGWAKPVPVNPYNFKNRRVGIIITSIAGPISNILLAFFSALILFKTNFTQESLGVAEFLKILFFMNTGLAVFNLLPLPPLDGSKIFAELFRGKMAYYIYSFEKYSNLILFMLLWFAPFRSILIYLNRLLGTIIINLVQIFI